MKRPFISVVTPVYNGEKWLADCIESVLSQEYTAFEYHIVNNCSTDGTLEIAQSYVKMDSRIDVRTNSKFVGAVENHNIAVGLVAPHASYCKVVSADDWILPKCISSLVNFGVLHPSVGIIGCYQRSGGIVKWQGVPPSVEVMSGRDAGRLGLLAGVHVLGTPTSVLYRADLLKMRAAFFPHSRSYADVSACYEALLHCDFGFVHEVLCEERVHPGQWSAKMDELDAGSVSYLEVLLRYGTLYLDEAELAVRRAQVFDAYYRGLGGCVWKLKGREFWNFHRSRLSDMGCELEWMRLAKAAITEAALESRYPRTAMRKALATAKGLSRPCKLG